MLSKVMKYILNLNARAHDLLNGAGDKNLVSVKIDIIVLGRQIVPKV